MPDHAPVVSDPLISHRGAPRLAPENTLPSFKWAAARGAKWPEVDVKLTADQRAVIIHDHTLERTTNGHGLVAGKTFDEVRSLDAGIQADLFGRYSVVRNCGRVGTVGRAAAHSYETEARALAAGSQLTMVKRSRGYRSGGVSE